MKITSVLLEANTPTLNGNVYSRDVLKKMISESKEIVESGKFFGTYKDFDKDAIDLTQVTHRVTNIDLVDDKVVATAEILDTPAGERLLIQLDKHPQDFVLRTVGFGIVEHNVVKDYKLVAVNIYDKKDCV